MNTKYEIGRAKYFEKILVFISFSVFCILVFLLGA
jgi:hypothetical protein